MSHSWIFQTAPAPSKKHISLAEVHQNTLTKPPGSLGLLEHIAPRFCGFQASEKPRIERICVRVFAADHGVCAQNVSAFPQIVTTQMIENFRRGGAAISVLCKNLNADLAIVNLGTAHPLIENSGIIQAEIGKGTADFTKQAAMTEAQCLAAMAVGKAQLAPCDLFIGGEMGIGNTSSASALYSALLKLSAARTVGPGTGINDATLQHKIHIIDTALRKHAVPEGATLTALATFGGFEIAALTGAFIGASQSGIPSLVDGFIATAAALVATEINPSIRPWLVFSHRSAEPAHKAALEYFQAETLLDLKLRLGEGSGAALCVPLIQQALLLHNHMATFEEAGVSQS